MYKFELILFYTKQSKHCSTSLLWIIFTLDNYKLNILTWLLLKLTYIKLHNITLFFVIQIIHTLNSINNQIKNPKILVIITWNIFYSENEALAAYNQELELYLNLCTKLNWTYWSIFQHKILNHKSPLLLNFMGKRVKHCWKSSLWIIFTLDN